MKNLGYWQERQVSTLQPSVLETDALPLSYAPMICAMVLPPRRGARRCITLVYAVSAFYGAA